MDPISVELQQHNKTWKIMRDDAIERGLQELAICYGWTMIRKRQEILTRGMSLRVDYRTP